MFIKRLDVLHSQSEPVEEGTDSIDRSRTPVIYLVAIHFTELFWLSPQERMYTNHKTLNVGLKRKLHSDTARRDKMACSIYTENVAFLYLYIQVGGAASIHGCNMHKTIFQPTDFVCLRARKQKYRYCSSIFNDSSATRVGGKSKFERRA